MPAPNRYLLALELTAERMFFRTRWIVVPGYFGLVMSLALLVYKTVISVWQLVFDIAKLDENDTVVRVLGIVDIVLVMNLLLMVIFVGYTSFVSQIRFDGPIEETDKPSWLGRLNYSGLKVQLMGSILAIASVKLLRAYFGIGTPNGMPVASLLWVIAVYATFVVALVCVAITNRLHVDEEDKAAAT
jgi:uncharacterized protein (TIGR00645 family)